jgi:hypothetical protein
VQVEVVIRRRAADAEWGMK